MFLNPVRIMTMEQRRKFYRIVARVKGNWLYPEHWSGERVGPNNEFATLDEAKDALESLLALGDEWAAPEYKIEEETE